MKTKPEGWNIVLAGFWNRAIFTPEWVGKWLFQETEVETLISVMPYLPIVYRNQQVAIEVSPVRLVFRPRQIDAVCLRAAEGMAHTVLAKLQDTPLIGVGVNFAFVEDNPRADLVELFNFTDDSALADVGWAVKERRLVRQVRRDDDTLNASLIFDGQNIAIEFNFHTETDENSAALHAVNQRAIGLRDEALKLLNDVYKLQPSEGEDGHG